MSKQMLNDNTTSDLKNSPANAGGDTSLHLTNGPAITDDNTCVVCFKNVEIYSIGECDHPVCYECSTRMRVLCQQNECPICRQVLSKVIFTFDKLPYRELETKNRSEYYSKKYKIGFYTSSIQQAFFELLNHQCPKCESAPFRTFNALQNHVRKEHDLHYCDLCRDHLKIFTFERRCYTQSELGLHRVKGDADNKSHRGHPLCEYCNCRYMDRDELFRHLRRDHYFCHFCDADGFNDFYRDYNALAEHFRQDHYLCEEGKCSSEQFTGAFRTEIDYKAHVAHVHGRSLNKQQVKQARTLQLEITLGRRGRTGQMAPDGACVGWCSRGNEDEHEEPPDLSAVPAQSNQRAITIDARNEVDFPSLNGAAAPSVSLIRPSASYKSCGSVAGLARTKENFPALGSGPSTSTAQNCTTTHSISNVVKRSQATVSATPARSTTANSVGSSSNPGGSTGLVIHVSNRPSTQPGVVSGLKKANVQDFPALPNAKHKKHAVNNRENHLDDTLPLPLPLANISAKHRSLVDDYVSVANRSTFQKIQVVRKGDITKVEEKKASPSSPSNIPKLTALDFPSLGISGSISSGYGSGSGSAIIGATVDCTRNGTNSWAKALDKKHRESENRKLKISLAPVLPKSNNKNAGNNHNSSESLTAGIGAKREKKPTNNVHGGEATALQFSLDGNCKAKINNNGNKSEKPNVNNDEILSSTATVNNNDTNSIQINRPPPGFDTDADENSSLLKPPPGFQSNIMVNSIVKSPNNLTFTSSLGESYNIITAHTYIQPADFIIRNQKLIGHFKENLETPEALNDFRYISQKFREGIYKTSAYYEHCQHALKDNFDKIFPELLVLLPDISKQQALYLVHFQRLKNLSIDERKLQTNLEVCAVCKQVLVSIDVENHKNVHKIKEQFPILNSPLKKESSGK